MKIKTLIDFEKKFSLKYQRLNKNSIINALGKDYKYKLYIIEQKNPLKLTDIKGVNHIKNTIHLEYVFGLRNKYRKHIMKINKKIERYV